MKHQSHVLTRRGKLSMGQGTYSQAWTVRAELSLCLEASITGMDKENSLVIGSRSTYHRQGSTGATEVNAELASHRMRQGHSHLDVLQHVEAVPWDVCQGHWWTKRSNVHENHTFSKGNNHHYIDSHGSDKFIAYIAYTGESVAHSENTHSRKLWLSMTMRGHHMNGWPFCARLCVLIQLTHFLITSIFL